MFPLTNTTQDVSNIIPQNLLKIAPEINSLLENQAEQWDEKACTGNIQIIYRAYQEMNLPILQKAFLFALQQYPLLTSNLWKENGNPDDQPNYSPEDLLFQQRDLSHLNQKEISLHLKEMLNTPFDLASDLLIRPYLLSYSAEEQIICFHIHAFIFNKISLIFFSRILWGAYLSYLQGRQPNVLLQLRYRDMIQWEQKMLADQEGVRHSYWEKQSAREIPVLALSIDYP